MRSERIFEFVLGALVTGFVVIMPVYLALLLLIKAIGSVMGL